MIDRVVKALILFGSRARGDGNSDSDFDVIAVVDGEVSVRSFEQGKLSISCYSKKFLLRIASEGNLFALHLISEAKVIFDPEGILAQMRNSFRKKGSYSKEIADASMLGWFLIRHADKVDNWSLFNKRVAWCVRTMLIATAYQEGQIFFSNASLFNYFNNSDAEWLIRNRHSCEPLEKTRFRFARVIDKYGYRDSGVYDVDDINIHIEYIFRSGNIVGKNTIESLFSDAHSAYLS